jgi:hypothetical protein
MKIEPSRCQDHAARNLVKGWFITLNLFFIIYSMFILGKFLLEPQSGRLSTLVCNPDPWGKLVCTVKIYGVHKLFRLDFYADDYIETYSSSNFYPGEFQRRYLNDLSLPWDNVPEQTTSDEYVCAVSIRTQRQLVDFVPPYQTSSVCSRAQAQLEAAFAGDRSAINIRFNGYNPQLYWQIALLVVASLLFLYQCAVRLRSRRREKNAMLVAEDQRSDSQPGTADILTDPDLQPAEEEAHPYGMGRKRFILFWWAASVLVIVFLVFSSLLNSLVRTGFWLSGCFLDIHDYQKLYLHYPIITNIIAILPYIILVTLWTVLQWQVMRTEVPVSRWWIAAPVIAGIPLLIGLPLAQNCMDYYDLASPPFFASSNPPAATTWSWVVSFLLFGVIQWLVLRRNLKYSIGWILVPFLSVFIEVFLLIYLFILSLDYIPRLPPEVFILPSIICFALIVLVLATIFNLVPGFYLHWAIRKRQTSLIEQGPG